MKKKVLISFMLLLPTLFTGCMGKKTNPEKYFTTEEIKMINEEMTKTPQTGTIIAYGGGFDTEETFKKIVNKCLEKADKPNPKMLFLPSGHKDKINEKEEVVEAFAAVGCQTEILLISKEPYSEIERKINEADIIYATGGNLEFLTTSWRETGAMELIKNAFYRGAVLVGVSTGAMCWAERGWDDCSDKKVVRWVTSFPFIGKDNEFMFLDSTGIIPFCVSPHFDNIAWREFKHKARKLDIPSIAIENGAAIIYQNGKYETFLDNPRRNVYLFYPEKNINMVNVTENPELITMVEIQRKLNAK